MELALRLARRLPRFHFGRAWALYRSRQALARLEPHMLRDIGLTPEAAARESARAPWDAPAHWLRG